MNIILEQITNKSGVWYIELRYQFSSVNHMVRIDNFEAQKLINKFNLVRHGSTYRNPRVNN